MSELAEVRNRAVKILEMLWKEELLLRDRGSERSISIITDGLLQERGITYHKASEEVRRLHEKISVLFNLMGRLE